MRRRLCFLFLPAVLLWGAAGCGSDAPADPGKGVEAGAAVLRADLTALLVDHAHLTGVTLLQARAAATKPANAFAAEDALAQSAASIGDAVADARGTAAGSGVAQSLRRYDELLVAAVKATDAAAVPSARLTSARDAVAEALTAAAPKLRRRSAAAALAPAAGVRAATGSPALAEAVDRYAGRMPELGEQLATAVVDADGAKRFDGDPGAGAAEIRTSITALMVDHVQQVALAALLGAGGPADGGAPAVAGARRALDRTAVELGDVVGSVYGLDAGGQVRAGWRKLQAGFASYTHAKLVKDDPSAELALGALDQTVGELADVLARAVPTLRRADVLRELQAHVAQTAAAIRAIAAGSPKLSGRIQGASEQVRAPAETLAAAIQRDQPAKFPVGS